MLYIFVLLIAVTSIHQTEACSCIHSHIQSLYCNSDFVMQVRLRLPAEDIYRKEEQNYFHDFYEGNNTIQTYIRKEKTDIKYSVKIRDIYKLKENTFGLNRNSTVTEIFTRPNEGICGVRLYQETNYLLSGKYENGVLRINLCNSIVEPWSFVTKMQKKGLRFSYQRSCDCEIQNIHYVSKVDPEACVYDPWNVHGKCYERQTACIPDKNSSTGGCKWQRNSRLKKCRLDAKSKKRLP